MKSFCVMQIPLISAEYLKLFFSVSLRHLRHLRETNYSLIFNQKAPK